MDGAPYQAKENTWFNTCQTTRTTLPNGWFIAEPTQKTINVIRSGKWATGCMYMANGLSIYTSESAIAGKSCEGPGGTSYMESSGGQWWVSSCSRRILIRRVEEGCVP